MYFALWRISTRLLSAYGGFSAIAFSPFVHAAAITAGAYSLLEKTQNVETLILQIIPSILGFSIGAYAIIFSVLGEEIIELISKREPEEKHSLLTQLSASFGYYVLIQAVTIIIAIMSYLFDFAKIALELFPQFSNILKEWIIVMSFIKFFFLIYSILLSVGIVFEIFRLSTVREE